MNATAPSRALIDLKAYTHNLDAVRRLAGEHTHVMAVVKAGAYGHGMVPIARKAIEWGAEMLGAATVEEGVELREAGITAPILVLTQPCLSSLAPIVEHDLTLMLSDVATGERLGELAHRANKVVRIHCKIDSGMGRQGFILEDALEKIQYLTRISPIDIEGVATHFPSADEPDDAFTYNQIRQFKQLLRQFDKQGIPFEMAHAANSAAVVNYPGSAFDMVRAGLMTYGEWPSKAPQVTGMLEQVLRWETRVTQVRELEPGATIGYGRTYTTPGRMRAAVLSVGYGDGYPHHLSNRADVLIHGQRCPLRGSVCMDQIVVDVTGLTEVRPGDPATLIGRNGDQVITAAELARHAGTIPYEILTNIGPRVLREYL